MSPEGVGNFAMIRHNKKRNAETTRFYYGFNQKTQKLETKSSSGGYTVTDEKREEHELYPRVTDETVALKFGLSCVVSFSVEQVETDEAQKQIRHLMDIESAAATKR